MSTSTAPAPTEVKHAPGSPGWLIEQAKQLEAEKGALLERVGANRDLLRSLAKVGALNAADAKFVATFYPTKDKDKDRSAEEVEATRKAREAARKAAK